MRSQTGFINAATAVNIITVIMFVLAAVMTIGLVRYVSTREAIEEAEEKAHLLLDRNFATHHYFTTTLKPRLFELIDPLVGTEYFEPSWMSSTYAIRRIHKTFDGINDRGYYYKECAINARHPGNEADSTECEFIRELNADPKLMFSSEVRDIGGVPFFVTMRRGETLEDTCMRCHSTPSEAPAELVERYGRTRSFNRNVGEVVSAISIRIPLSEAMASNQRLTSYLSGAFAVLLASVFIIQYLTNRTLIYRPLMRLRTGVAGIIQDRERLGCTIDPPRWKELAELTVAFNRMSESLLDERETLENNVRKRTAELEDALENVKQLKGLLPICASCKRVREDTGYWTQIEQYIREHSEAEFSHGICPDCMKKLYPEFDPNIGSADETRE